MIIDARKTGHPSYKNNTVIGALAAAILPMRVGESIEITKVINYKGEAIRLKLLHMQAFRFSKDFGAKFTMKDLKDRFVILKLQDCQKEKPDIITYDKTLALKATEHEYPNYVQHSMRGALAAQVVPLKRNEAVFLTEVVSKHGRIQDNTNMRAMLKKIQEAHEAKYSCHRHKGGFVITAIEPAKNKIKKRMNKPRRVVNQTTTDTRPVGMINNFLMGRAVS